MTPARVHIEAPAKINLHLAVGDRRPDGYHDVETVLQTVSLCDAITIEGAEQLAVHTVPELGIPAEANLAWRAATAMGLELGRTPTQAIRILKRIPDGAGLGGGSSDAAAVIAGLATLWSVPLDDPRLEQVAASLGADVPFFLTGGTALFGDRGDRMIRRLPTTAMHVVLAKPHDPVSTAAAYAAFDQLPGIPPETGAGIVTACESRDPAAISSAVYNNMTRVSVELAAGIGEALALMRTAEGVTVAEMAGSGSAVFALCRDAESAERAERLARDAGLWAARAVTTGTGVTLGESEGAP